MALSNEDKQRIREEEEFRAQVRREQRFARREGDQWKVYFFWAVIAAVAALLFLMIRTR